MITSDLKPPSNARTRRTEMWIPLIQAVGAGLLALILLVGTITYLHVDSELSNSHAEQRSIAALVVSERQRVETDLHNQNAILNALAHLAHQNELTLKGLDEYAQYLTRVLDADNKTLTRLCKVTQC